MTDRIFRTLFYYGTTGNGFCGQCITGHEGDIPNPEEYEPVPEEHLEVIVCENCGAVHVSWEPILTGKEVD